MQHTPTHHVTITHMRVRFNTSPFYSTWYVVELCLHVCESLEFLFQLLFMMISCDYASQPSPSKLEGGGGVGVVGSVVLCSQTASTNIMMSSVGEEGSGQDSV